jgi:hypothetical protein
MEMGWRPRDRWDESTIQVPHHYRQKPTSSRRLFGRHIFSPMGLIKIQLNIPFYGQIHLYRSRSYCVHLAIAGRESIIRATGRTVCLPPNLVIHLSHLFVCVRGVQICMMTLGLYPPHSVAFRGYLRAAWADLPNYPLCFFEGRELFLMKGWFILGLFAQLSFPNHSIHVYSETRLVYLLGREAIISRVLQPEFKPSGHNKEARVNDSPRVIKGHCRAVNQMMDRGSFRSLPPLLGHQHSLLFILFQYAPNNEPEHGQSSSNREFPTDLDPRS